MAQPLTPMELTDPWEVWFEVTNELINAVSTVIMTANSSPAGAITVGNSHLFGIFSATEIAANTIRGGNVQSSGNLYVTSNIIFQENVYVTGQFIYDSNSDSTFGNSTVNVVINSTSISFVDPEFNSWYGANGWSVSNGSVTFTFHLPSAADQANPYVYLHANGSWVDASGQFERIGLMNDRSLRDTDTILSANDRGSTIEFVGDIPVTLTIPNTSTETFPNNFWADLVQFGEGKMTLVEGDGVIIHAKEDSRSLANQYSAGTIYYRGNDEWMFVGDVEIE